MDSRSRLLLDQLGIPVWISQQTAISLVDGNVWQGVNDPDIAGDVVAVLAIPLVGNQVAKSTTQLLDSAVQAADLTQTADALAASVEAASQISLSEPIALETALSIQLYRAQGDYANCLFLIDVTQIDTPELLTLWQNMCNAFGARLQDQLDWPFSSHAVWQSSIDPQQVVHGFLTQITPPQVLLIVGLLPITLPALAADITIFQAPSLRDMKQNTAAKRILWDYMKSCQTTT